MLEHLGWWQRIFGKGGDSPDQPAPPPLKGRWVIFSGAGLSQDSGLATFRDQNGLWDNHNIQEVCHASTWRQHRDKVNAFYEKRWQDNLAAKPHEGHAWCAQMEARGATLITQNIDTLLERAGAQRVIHVHGRIDQWQCFECDYRWRREEPHTPQCQACGSMDTRVDVVFFGERARGYPAMQHVLTGLRDEDTLVVIGTSGTVVNPLLWLTERPRVIILDAKQPDTLLNAWPSAEVLLGHAKDVGSMMGGDHTKNPPTEC